MVQNPDRHTDRQTDRHTYIQTDIHTYRQTERQTCKETESQGEYLVQFEIIMPLYLDGQIDRTIQTDVPSKPREDGQVFCKGEFAAWCSEK